MTLVESLRKSLLGPKKMGLTRSARIPNKASKRRLMTETLEGRNLMAGVVFDSLSGIGNGDDLSQAFAIDADQVGNSYVTGRFSGTVDFEPSQTFPNGSDTLTASGASDVFVAKYSSNGTLTWVIQMGGSDSVNISDWGRNIKATPVGDIYVGGEFIGVAAFGNQTLVAAGGLSDTDVFLTKINTNGLIQWSKSWGASTYDAFLGLDVDASGNAYAASNRSNGALTVKKFGTSGSAIWTKSVEANSGYVGEGDLAVDVTGNVFISANFIGTVDFDPSNKTKLVVGGNSSIGLGNGYVLSLNSSGNFRWVSPFLARTDSSGYRGFAVPTSLAVDNLGDVLVGGWRSGLVDFQASSATFEFPSNRSGYLVKLNNSNGYLGWAKSFEMSNTAANAVGSMYVDDIEVDAVGNTYLAGAFKGIVDFDPGIAENVRTVESIDAYYLKLGSTGEPIWLETLGSSGSEWARGIAIDGTGAVHVAGTIGLGSGPVDFDPDPLSSQELTTNTRGKGFRLRVRQV